jgi:DNA repair exonuclease SbcCD ATPase subunit
VELQSRAEHLKGQIRKIEAKEKRLLELFLDDDLAQTEQARVKLKEFAGERGRLTEALQRVEEVWISSTRRAGVGCCRT